jgi:membrane carboxypeptidase/penicillin-binding protein PbpC
VVWVGRDDNGPTRLSGSKGALPIWARFMLAVRPAAGYSAFEAAPGVVEVEIDPTTGQLAGASCPQRRRELFQVGRAPTATCAAIHFGLEWPLLTVPVAAPTPLPQHTEDILSFQTGATAASGPSHIIIRRAPAPSAAVLRRVDLSRSALADTDGQR